MSVHVVRVRKQGNSLGVSLPRAVILALGLKPADAVALRVDGRVMTMAKVNLNELIGASPAPRNPSAA